MTLYYSETTETYRNGLHSGLKTIKVYRILINKPVLLTKMRIPVDGYVEEEIQFWLNENGHEDKMFKFSKL